MSTLRIAPEHSDDDRIPDNDYNCPQTANADQTDADDDGAGDECDSNGDNDARPDDTDNCTSLPNDDQQDLDQDGIGDACDDDSDGDGVPNAADACGRTPPARVTDSAGCTIDQVCPCDGPSSTVLPWRNHGNYVSCVAQVANRFLLEGLTSDTEHGEIVSTAGQSTCDGSR